MTLTFEWDPEKAAQNRRHHGVSFDEASRAFRDPLSRTIHDPEYSEDEDRFLLLGESGSGRLLGIAHTERGGRIRIIIARVAGRRERKTYQEVPG